MSQGLTISRLRLRGAAAVLAMLFLVILSTLTLAMFSMATSNVQSAANLGDVERARAAAESGLRFTMSRFNTMARPKTLEGTIDSAAAVSLWTPIVNSVTASMNLMLATAERGATQSVVTATDGTAIKTLTLASIAQDSTVARFRVTIQQHPLFAGDTMDARYLRVASAGSYRSARRTLSMDFKIDKKVNFAVVGKVPIQLGRNTLIEGPIAMATPDKFPPLLQLSDFTHFDSALATKIAAFQAFLASKHTGYDNRVSVNNATELAAATAAGYADTNHDGYIDEYDLFLKQYDKNNDRAISVAEFTNSSTGQSFDANLFAAIDSLGGPQFVGDTTRAGYKDGIIDNRDAYAKVEGSIVMATNAAAWEANLAGSGNDIHDMIAGPVVSTDTTQSPVRFDASTSDVFDLSPANFETACANFRARSGTAAGTASQTSTAIKNKTLTPAMANGTAVTERTPLGSTSYQATYKRPVFKNLTLTNVIVPKGLNALFDNCVFQGVTVVDTERDITNSAGSVSTNSNDGMTWATKKLSGDAFTKDKILLATGTPVAGQTITAGSQNGNNLRFNNCTFNGPLAGNYATAYTHFSNSWEFTGATMFDNKVDETATILSPQVNIEMGSFTDPGLAPSTLIGVLVAGNIDIRGTSIVDGSIIITGDGAGNTTLGYFGASDSDTNPSALPEGGFGRLVVTYNPYRALPDGINVAIDLVPQADTYAEAK